MISKELITKLSVKSQTDEDNVARKYVQNLFLSSLYKLKDSGKLLLKGGTALRLIYKSPRYSEDLDFTGNQVRIGEIDDLLQDVFVELERTGFKVRLDEATRTSGGYLGKIFVEFYNYNLMIKMEVSLREKTRMPAETSIVESEFIPNYMIFHLPLDILVREKVNALLTRGKARDYFDIYFLLRNNKLPATEKTRLKKIQEAVEKMEIDFKRELGTFLPMSFHPIIKGFKGTFLREVGLYLRK